MQQVMDMTTAMNFREHYTDPTSDLFTYAYALGIGVKPEQYNGPQTLFGYLLQMQQRDTHGKAFHYITPNTDILGWIISKVTGKGLAQVIEEHIWRKLGARRDAYLILDSNATAAHGGGLNITLRDAARFGQMVLRRGQYNQQQILPKSVAKRILTPGDTALFNVHYQDKWHGDIAYAYHDQWWTLNNKHKAVSAMGILGQYIYIDPVTEVVIVAMSSDAQPSSYLSKIIGPQLLHVIAVHVGKSK